MFRNKILFFLFILTSTFVLGQTTGFNYQALILNTQEIQIPGTDVAAQKVPLGLTDIKLRFNITNENGIEYTEEHAITTDENGMVSVIVGEGTPINFTFDDIYWDGKIKHLNVELNVLSNSEGYVFLDSQKILYIPHPQYGTANVYVVNTLEDLEPHPPYKLGDLIWLTEFGENKNPTLMIWDKTKWVPVNDDIDPTNELGLVVVADNAARDIRFNPAVIGDQAWNEACQCVQVYNGVQWISLPSDAVNGLYKDGSIVKLGGALTEPTAITTDTTNTLAIKGMQESTTNEDQVVMADKETGVLKQRPISSITQQKQVVIIAVDGQLEFTTPLTITSLGKINVYRNGVRIDFTAVNNTTIKLEPEAICYQNDKIRIVQLY